MWVAVHWRPSCAIAQLRNRRVEPGREGGQRASCVAPTHFSRMIAPARLDHWIVSLASEAARESVAHRGAPAEKNPPSLYRPQETSSNDSAQPSSLQIEAPPPMTKVQTGFRPKASRIPMCCEFDHTCAEVGKICACSRPNLAESIYVGLMLARVLPRSAQIGPSSTHIRAPWFRFGATLAQVESNSIHIWSNSANSR